MDQENTLKTEVMQVVEDTFANITPETPRNEAIDMLVSALESMKETKGMEGLSEEKMPPLEEEKTEEEK